MPCSSRASKAAREHNILDKRLGGERYPLQGVRYSLRDVRYLIRDARYLIGGVRY
jgi:hypothetical protein